MPNDDVNLRLRRVVAKAVRAFGAAQATRLYECPDGSDDRNETDEHPPPAFIAVVPALDPEGEACPDDADVGDNTDNASKYGDGTAVGLSNEKNDKNDGDCRQNEDPRPAPILPTRDASFEREEDFFPCQWVLSAGWCEDFAAWGLVGIVHVVFCVVARV